MTQALDAVIAKLSTLPAEEQDRIAQWFLDELDDEEHWSKGQAPRRRPSPSFERHRTSLEAARASE